MTRLDKQVWLETRDEPALPDGCARFTAHWLTHRPLAGATHANVHAAPLVGDVARTRAAFETSGDVVRVVAEDPAGYAAFLAACAAWRAPAPELEGADRG